ncbi:MAG: DHA2 family efflux MFS transporter permease subunit [Ignavibacteriae bacterium]|nr:MAG: DHA2 family efflux MFS transporter permease subunit [Ignavibacteriota bacterium]
MFEGITHRLKQGFTSRVPSLHHEHDWYRWWVLANIMIGTFMVVLDATIVDVALSKIMSTFGVSVDKVEWVVTAYMLVFAVLLPTSGWIADHFGYKRTYFLALALFTLGSFLCGLAWNENMLILFRIVQACGAGLLMPTGMAIVTREFPPKQRGLALGFWAISAAASVSLGPMIGGYLIDTINWNAIFNVNVPVGIMGLFATAVIQREYKTERTRSFDVIGFISMAAFLCALLLALTDGNAAWNTGGWTSPFIISCFMIAALSLTIFFITELTIEHPLIDLSLFKDFNFSIANGILFIFGFGMFGSTFLLPLYLQLSLGYTAFQAGSLFLPVGILQAITAPISGYLSDKIDPRIPAGIGITLLAGSLFINSSLSLYSEHHQIMLALYIRGFAMGLMFTPLSMAALSNVPKHKIGQASGLFNIIRQLGGSFGIAFMSTLLLRRTIYHMAIYGQAVNPQSDTYHAVAQHLSRFSMDAMAGNQTLGAMRANALIASHISTQSFIQAVGDDFLIASIITIAALVPILFIRTKKREKSEHVIDAE